MQGTRLLLNIDDCSVMQRLMVAFEVLISLVVRLKPGVFPLTERNYIIYLALLRMILRPFESRS
ncbi:MAG: hypothetical protein EB157_06000 [Euryarchaeota archaeon]|nr:hypothetical protein [Euryarchaeota archaeon]